MPDRFYIGPYDAGSGVQNNYRPFVIPEKAFEQLNNAYVWRGRVRKRFGTEWIGNTQLSSRLRVSVGSLNAPSSPVPLGGGAIGQMFSIADVIFTVNALGSPATLLVSNGSATTAEFDTATGAFTFVGVLDSLGVAVPLATTIYWYPALPVMGLLSVENATLNNEPTFAFDTRMSYRYLAGGWERISAETNPGDALWSGSDSQFFSGVTWSGAEPFDYTFFVTNFNENEANYMRYNQAGVWTGFRPKVSNLVPGSVNDIWLDSCRLIVVFKNRLVALNTWETSDDGSGAIQKNYPNRARYSQVGSPLAVDAWRQDIQGRGNAIDCPTRQQIVGAQFIKDRLIVYFERSTWELVYTGNVAYPFAWQQINSEIGAESSFSVVPFDRVAIGVGQNGIHACNGSNVERIDQLIPDTVFEIHNNNAGPERVYGIRDYSAEMVYWTFPAINASSTFPYPARILAYNYVTQTWAFFDDSYTCFGYFQETTGVTWDSTQVTWDDPVSWSSASLQGLFRNILAGNQEGWTFKTNIDTKQLAPSLQITDMAVIAGMVQVTAVNHNLKESQYVLLSGIDDTGNLNSLNGTIAQVVAPITANTFMLGYVPPYPVVAGTYKGSGVLARVSQIQIRSKEFNFYAEQGMNVQVTKIDFLVDRTAEGAITAEYFVSSSIDPQLDQGINTSTQIGTGILETSPYASIPLESYQSRLWHPQYFWGDGEYFQIYLYYSDTQMRSTEINSSDFQLHAMIIHASTSSIRLQ